MEEAVPYIEPFRGILYNPKKADISKTVAPPYDVISPQLQDELYLLDSHNIVRLILGKEKRGDSKRRNRYKRAKQYFNKWLKEGVLVQDKAPYLYVYSQEYLHEGKKRTRLGFIGRMRLEDPATSRVLPHEYTFLKPKQDRLNLIREVNANLCCIFSLFQDKDRGLEKILKRAVRKRPVFGFEYESVRHKLWRLDDKGLIKKIQASMSGKEIYIADGHHRYEVALSYRDEMLKQERKSARAQEHKIGEKGYDYVMMYFAPMSEEGLTILSTHRVVRNIFIKPQDFVASLKRCFYVKETKSIKELFKEMSSAREGEYVVGVYLANKRLYLLKLKKENTLEEVIKETKSKEWKRLDVSILHGVIFEHILGLKEKAQEEDNIIYTRDAYYAKEEVESARYDAAFFLNPTKINQVETIAKIGDRMPHKSTYFYPKLLSGLVINKLTHT